MRKIKMHPTYPPPLPPNATIGIVAPSGPADPDDLNRGLEYLHSRGYRTKLASNLTENNGFTAGSRQTRLDELVAMFEDDEVDAIFCARGGDGAIHLIPELIERLKNCLPKIFLGYSDITLLQLAMYRHLGWITFSGPMVATEFGKNQLTEGSLNHLWKLLTTSHKEWNLIPNFEHEIKLWRSGSGRGPLLGGCLALVTSLLGSPHLPDFQDAILVIEDTDETPERIDRMLHQLRISGIFDQISGLIVGQFRNCFPKDLPDEISLKNIVMRAVADYDFPVIGNFPYGHHTPEFSMLPIGARIRLDSRPLKLGVE